MNIDVYTVDIYVCCAGAADLLGNPLGLLTAVSRGVRDLVAEPAAGLAARSAGGFGLGVARGAVSLAQHTAFGVASSTR